MNNERTISINPQFLNISKKKMKALKPDTSTASDEVKLNTTNIRQLLLERLRQHKKKKNQKTQKFPVQLNTMDEQIKLETIEQHIPLTKFNSSKPIFDVCSNSFDSISNNLPIQSNIEKPYGNLKNGNKPTFKSWTQKEPGTPTISSPVMSTLIVSSPAISKPVICEPVTPDTDVCYFPEPVECPMIEEKEIKKTFNIGKNKKENAVSILIKNNRTRKKIESDKIALKKTSLSTLKNFLKKQNLIKFGSTAPSQLLREIYENTKLCGDIINENPQNILHNFKET
jgi:hypothetical protein